MEREANVVQEASPFSLAEYVQMACMGRHTLVIEVQTEYAHGSIAMSEGKPWSAHYGAQRGEQAFCAMINAAESAIQVRQWPGPAGPRELLHGCQELLMQAAVQRDEARHLGELVNEGLRAVVAGDYGRAAKVLEQARAIDPENARVRHQLKRLAVLGHGAQAAKRRHVVA